MRKAILVLTLLPTLFLFLVAPRSASADVSVTLRLDRREATLVDTIRMVIKVSGTRSNNLEPIVKGLETFRVTQSGTSSRVEIINGKVNAGIDYTYFIQPKETGSFEIGPAEVTFEGKTFRSNTETLAVVRQPHSSGVDRGPLFLSAEISPKKVYVEEQAIYTLKLYRLNRARDISIDLPQAEHLTFKQLGKPLEYQSAYRGKYYQVLEVRYALIPSKEGTYGIEPTKMSMTVLQAKRRSPFNLFDDPFFNNPFFSFSSGRPITVASDPLELDVLPLPEQGRPSDFSGLVGTFEIESRLEPSKIKAGESATLTVSLSGRGNMNRLPDLKVPELAHTKVYADQPVLEMKQNPKGLAGSKTMKWALVPEREGRYNIPPLSVSFFDTTSRQYRIIRTTTLSLSVLPGEKEQMQASANLTEEQRPEGPEKQKVKQLGRDILPVHTSIKDLASHLRVRPGGILFWSVLIAPFFVYAATFCGITLRKKSEQSMPEIKAKKAAKNLVRQYRQKELSSNDLSLRIRDYLNDRFGLSLGSLTPEEARKILSSRAVSLETAERLSSLVRRLEDTIYTGKGHEPFDTEVDIPKLIKQIEKEIR